MNHAARAHQHPASRHRPRFSAAQAPRPGAMLSPEFRRGPRLLSRSRRGALHRLPAGGYRSNRTGAGQVQSGRWAVGSVRQRPALCRVLVSLGRYRSGVLHRAGRPLRRPARTGGATAAADRASAGDAGARRRGFGSSLVRAAGLRGGDGAAATGRAVPGLGRQSVCVAHPLGHDHGQGAALPFICAAAGAG